MLCSPPARGTLAAGSANPATLGVPSAGPAPAPGIWSTEPSPRLRGTCAVRASPASQLRQRRVGGDGRGFQRDGGDGDVQQVEDGPQRHGDRADQGAALIRVHVEAEQGQVSEDHGSGPGDDLHRDRLAGDGPGDDHHHGAERGSQRGDKGGIRGGQVSERDESAAAAPSTVVTVAGSELTGFTDKASCRSDRSRPGEAPPAGTGWALGLLEIEANLARTSVNPPGRRSPRPRSRHHRPPRGAPSRCRAPSRAWEPGPAIAGEASNGLARRDPGRPGRRDHARGPGRVPSTRLSPRRR